MNAQLPLWDHRCVYTLSWQRFEDGTQQIFRSLQHSGFRPDALICIARGGLVVGTKIAHLLDISHLITLHIQRNKTSDMFPDRQLPHTRMNASLALPEQARLLVVDDIVGSGATMQTAIALVKAYHPLEIQTASLAVNTNGLKHEAAQLPDYFAFEVDDWLVFPWENVLYYHEMACSQHLPLKEL